MMTNQFDVITAENEMRDLARVTSEELLDVGDVEDIRPPRDNCAAWAAWGQRMAMLRAIHVEIAGKRPASMSLD